MVNGIQMTLEDWKPEIFRGGVQLYCFGSPCQDFSMSGRRKGLAGERSVLVREIFRLLDEQEEENRPEWLVYENVKGMLFSNRGLDYLSILSEFDRLGYDCEWQNINSAWYVPQNRERIFTIGHLRKYGIAKIFPIEGTNGENSIDTVGHSKNYRQSILTYATNGISGTLTTQSGGNNEIFISEPVSFCDTGKKVGINPTTNCRMLHAHYYKGCINRREKENSGVLMQIEEVKNNSKNDQTDSQKTKLALPVLTPDRALKQQNGRRIKENGEPSYCLTTEEVNGVALKPDMDIKEDGNEKHEPMYATLQNGVTAYCVWYEKYQSYITIRKLTPKECFRLQGWTDDYFEKAEFVNSDSQLYKQAGNGVTINVVYEIGKKLQEQKSFDNRTA